MFGKTTGDNICPLLREPCIGDRCKFWTHIRGKHPQSGADLDMPDCAVKWLPVLMIEASQETRQAGASVEGARNEIARGFGDLVTTMRALPARRDLDLP